MLAVFQIASRKLPSLALIGSVVVQWQSALLETEGPQVRPHMRHCVVVLEQDTFILA